MIHQMDSKTKWLLLSASFTAKFGLVYALTSENPFLNNGTTDFQNNPPFEKSAGFYVTIGGNFEGFQCFNFEADFLENENLFQKTGVSFFISKH